MAKRKSAQTANTTEPNKEQTYTAAGVKSIHVFTEFKVNTEWLDRIPCREYTADELKNSKLCLGFDYTTPRGELKAFDCNISLLELIQLILSSKYVHTFEFSPEHPNPDVIMKEVLENFIDDFCAFNKVCSKRTVTEIQRDLVNRVINPGNK